MNPTRIAADALRDAMLSCVPRTGAALTPQLAYRIKRKAIGIMKMRGLDVTAYKHQIKLEFLAPDKPNLIIPPHALHPTAH